MLPPLSTVALKPGGTQAVLSSCTITHGLVLDATYVAVFLGGALLVFARKDVTA